MVVLTLGTLFNIIMDIITIIYYHWVLLNVIN